MDARAYPMIVLLLPLVAAILLFAKYAPIEETKQRQEYRAKQGEIEGTEQGQEYRAKQGEIEGTKQGQEYRAKQEQIERTERRQIEETERGQEYRTKQEQIEGTEKGKEYRTKQGQVEGMKKEQVDGMKKGQVDGMKQGQVEGMKKGQVDGMKRGKNAMQELLYGRLEAGGLRGDELATTGALTLGYKEDLGKELKRHFQASGAAHVLAVSGLHTGIIYGLLLGLLTLGGRYKPLYDNRSGRAAVSLVIIGVMWFYAWLTGMTPSVVRAVLMLSIYEAGKMCYRQAFSLNTIAAAAVLILIVNPKDLWSVSFQLSFAATSAIVLLLSAFPDLPPKGGGITSKILQYFGGIIMVSLAAQLGTLPLTMYYFGQISCYFLLTNMLVLPLATFLVPCGLLSVALGGSGAGIVFSKVTQSLAWAMNHSVAWIESLPGSTVKVSIGSGMVAIYYVLFLVFCVYIQPREKV